MSDAPSNNQDEMDLNFHTDMPVGEILRRTRRHYGQSLDQIEQVLRIRASQLEALEQGEVHKLPGRVYAIGFVRSYSEYLGLDGDKMVHLFKEQSVGRKQAKPQLTFPVPASESKIPNAMVIGGSIFGLLVLIGFVSFLMLPGKEDVAIPAVPESLTKSQLNQAPSLVAPTTSQNNSIGGNSATGAPAQPSTDTLAPSAANSNRIVLEIVEASWIEIKNAAGAAILRQVLKPGDMYLVPNEPGMVMATGNAGGVRIKVDGRDIGPLGTTGQIRRKIPLDPANLVPVAPSPTLTTPQ